MIDPLPMMLLLPFPGFETQGLLLTIKLIFVLRYNLIVVCLVFVKLTLQIELQSEAPAAPSAIPRSLLQRLFLPPPLLHDSLLQLFMDLAKALI